MEYVKHFQPTEEAIQLWHEGALALSQVEAEGVRVDKAYLEHQIDSTATQIREYEEALRADPDYHHWRRRYGTDVNFNQNKQLAEVVFGDLGFKRKKKLDERARDTDNEGEFEGVDIPLKRNFFARKKLHKLRGTYLLGVQRELVQHDDGDWYVHPSYHLNTVATFRSSASDPNWTNIPNRNPVTAEIIRRTYISRRGQQISEYDLGQIETRTPCFYSFDLNLMTYCNDPTRDMHRDVASQLFYLTEKQAKHKPIRHIAKNSYVFPVFYGSYYRQTATWIWEDLVIGADGKSVMMPEGDKTVIQHLAEQGITELGACDPKQRPVKGTFEYHCQTIDEDFTQRRFKDHWAWKEAWYRQYQKDGGCQFLTGFIMVGPHAKNDITNYCIQGVSFHIPLWALIKINRLLRRYQFKTRIIGEVHDCINFDGPPREREDVANLTVKVMTEDVVKHWPWINVAITCEPEVCPVDGCWFNKVPMVKRETWEPADMQKWIQNYGAWQ